MKKLSTLAMALAAAYTLQAQSNPEPHDLSQGAYTFTTWEADSDPGTYPANMVFHVYDTDNVGPDVNSSVVGDWLCRYDIESRARFIGEGDNGFSFLNTGDTQNSQARCGNGPDDVGGFVGAATLALNTIGLENISGTYLATKMTAGTNDVPREYIVRVEYRVGESGMWTALESTALSSATTELNDPQDVSFTLPAEANDQAVVQLRWRYYQAAQNDGGQRPQWRVGSINVSAAGLSAGAHEGAIRLGAFPNPSGTGKFRLSEQTSGTLHDLTGKAIVEVPATDVIDLSTYAAGVYIFKTREGAVLRLIRQ